MIAHSGLDPVKIQLRAVLSQLSAEVRDSCRWGLAICFTDQLGGHFRGLELGIGVAVNEMGERKQCAREACAGAN